MNVRRSRFKLALGLPFIALAAASLACALFPLPALPGERQAQTVTAAAATGLRQVIQTEAAQIFAATSTQAAIQASAVAARPTSTSTSSATPSPSATLEPSATSTPLPGPTYLPPSDTPSPTPTATPTLVLVAGPSILVQVDANCRAGPSTRYVITSYLSAGDRSRVYGSDTYRHWWLIADPMHPGELCWVAHEPTNVKGDTYRVPVVAASELPDLTFDFEQNKYWCNPFSPSDQACCSNSASCYPEQVDELECVLWGNCMPTTGSLYFRKFGCPAVTCINQENYCENYPKCCGVEK